MITLTLPGTIRTKKTTQQPTPIPANRETRVKYKPGKRPDIPWRFARILILPGKAYKEWEEKARWEAILQMKQGGHQIQHGPLHVRATIYFKGPEPDLSGCLESVGDCLEGIVWANDRQIKSWDKSRVLHNKDNPRTEVEIVPADLAQGTLF